jgi:hypothetical protein
VVVVHLPGELEEFRAEAPLYIWRIIRGDIGNAGSVAAAANFFSRRFLLPGSNLLLLFWDKIKRVVESSVRSLRVQ